MASATARPERADAAAWLAVAAGTIGSLMALLDVSIVNSSLPTIQGAIGASGSEGTWVSTAYLVAEIVMIALAGWFQRLLGLRRFLLIVTTLFIGFSMVCGLATSLGQMIIGRVGQGFTGGAMIPTAMTIVATRLPPRQQPVGIALFGVTAVLGPVIGPLLGGWLTENISWHYAFFVNLPVSILLLGLLFVGLQPQKGRPEMLLGADWIGIVGLTLGLSCLTVVLEEGQRERWFESRMIITLTVLCVVGFILLSIGQLVAKEPVIYLRILRDRSFGMVFLISLVVGAALYGLLYLIPQFLANVSGYNALQSGYVVLISGIPPVAMMALFPWFARTVDVRILIAAGLLFFSISCFMNAQLTPESVGMDFVWPQVMRGFGQYFSMLFLNQAATSAVGKEYAEDAAGLFNGARNLGGSFGLALVSTMQERRDTLHLQRLGESVTANSVMGQDAVHRVAQIATARDGDPTGGALRGTALLMQQLVRQASVMTYADLFWLFGIFLICTIPLVLFLKPLRQQREAQEPEGAKDASHPPARQVRSRPQAARAGTRRLGDTRSRTSAAAAATDCRSPVPLALSPTAAASVPVRFGTGFSPAAEGGVRP